jgi:hypothetical protein
MEGRLRLHQRRQREIGIPVTGFGHHYRLLSEAARPLAVRLFPILKPQAAHNLAGELQLAHGQVTNTF